MQRRRESTRPIFIRESVASRGIAVGTVTACGGDPTFGDGARGVLTRHREKGNLRRGLRRAIDRGSVSLQRARKRE
jgi:hypothetical protein